MSSASVDFFKEYESSDELFSSSSKSSLLLPSSFTDLSCPSDAESADESPFKSLAWDQNLVDLFNNFAETDNKREEDVTNTHTATRGEILREDYAGTTSKPPQLDNSLYETQSETNVRLGEHFASAGTYRTDNCSNKTHGNDCFAPVQREYCNLPEQRQRGSKFKDIETQPAINTSDTQHHTNTESWKDHASQSDDRWNTDTQYGSERLSHQSEKDSGYDEMKGATDKEDALSHSDESDISERHQQIQGRIVDLLHQIERCINEGTALTIRRKPRWDTCTIEDGILQTTDPSNEGRTIRPANARRLQLMVKILATIYQLLATGTSCTKRELYYLHLDLAQTPHYTYAVLDDIGALLDADTWEMNVFNTSKGLIAGPLVLTLSDGQTIDCRINRWGTPVPLDVSSVIELRVTAKLVLVVEKDTVFKRLLEDGIFTTFPDTIVLITAKGYPDVSTRLLLKKIADWSKVPIYALMDADPHGIEIFCVYKFGSLAMVHHQRSLAVPSMRWIGLFPSDMELLGLQGIPLRERELKRIEQMIKRPYTQGHIQRELLLLRQLATKAEIESLYNIASDFITTVYLKGKFQECVQNSPGTIVE
ncbi:meiotic recombination protein SPO11 [Anopheles moucheti]|uniref:meiotic recombination protein SPO11 n=1 Tax=Anopheles moucheti TaxID=186751 RepID=UPI0022F003A6|nr:meiotic recombination protein SPO11 [Anopheles moucheti]